MNFDLPYYQDYISPLYADYLIDQAQPVFEIEDLLLVGESGGLESKESLEFLVKLYVSVEDDLKQVLKNRIKDRKFIDDRNKSIYIFNKNVRNNFYSSEYKTILGEKDANDRIVIGPHSKDYVKNCGKNVAAIPKYLQGYHVTLFGPPDSKKMCINAMNSFHRKLKNEPAIVEELVGQIDYTPKWGADNEDSKTPLHNDLKSAGINLSNSLDHNLDFTDERGKDYKLKKTHLSHAIKRFPGIALPSFFMFYKGNPIPLHLYDFALHAYRNWHNPEALVFYVPKLENEEEARYIKIVMETAETMIKAEHPEYVMGTIRLMIVLENPRAVFRVNEIMDELYPYFVGASLGWHDYLGSTARLFKEDPNYRIPVKADPDIVIKYIKASHLLLADIVGERGGIKVGGMYGILPTTSNIDTDSFQVTIVGYIRDVVTQLKRNLTGFWVAHPDFVRLGIAMVEAWKIKQAGDDSKLEELVKSLLNEKYHQDILDFINGPDIEGLNINDPMYARSLLVADIGESNIIANNDAKEIRYNVFQSLQYITDWLTGNGCVALPTSISDVAVRIMDDLATAERSRWEVWHELYHGRFKLNEFLKIVHEEFNFIRKDLSDTKKIVQVKWNDENAKWYPVALNLMIKLMTDRKPAEFATELLLPFTITEIRESDDPWEKAYGIDPDKFFIDQKILNFNYYFEICGEQSFASALMNDVTTDMDKIETLIMFFNKAQIINASNFHGNIGESKNTLDKMASQEQEKVFDEKESVKDNLRVMGAKYLKKFGFKFLISAQNKTGKELLNSLIDRLSNTESEELMNARRALFEITQKRVLQYPLNNLNTELECLIQEHKVKGLQVSLCIDGENIQTLSFGHRNQNDLVDENTLFEIASLSKTIGSALALGVFENKNIDLNTPVNDILKSIDSEFRLDDKSYEMKVTLEHLMNHSALNMHYVNGIAYEKEMPLNSELLMGNKEFGYDAIKVINDPGTRFQYSGAGFILLEYIIEKITNKKFTKLLDEFLNKLEITDISEKETDNYAWGFHDNGLAIEGTRLKFPLIAAGMMGSTSAMHKFLLKLVSAFHNLEGVGPISHDVAVKMLSGKNLGSKEFMGCDMGLGVFTAECGPNKLMIHQGANDGYRTLYLHCFDGPDKGKGFSIFANGELNALLLNSYVAQKILKQLNLNGVDFNNMTVDFNPAALKQEEVVNLGYKNFIFDAFVENLPDIETSEQVDLLSEFNILNGGRICHVSNQKFARASNLLLSTIPKFDPELFGKQGKVMDSWESVRHNPKPYEILIIELEKKSDVSALYLSTKYHDGNHVDFVSIDGENPQGEWIEILYKKEMGAHSFRKIILSQKIKDISKIRIRTYPDGGFTRLKIFEEVPKGFTACGVTRFDEKIPVTLKSLNLTFIESSDYIGRIRKGEMVDLASSAYGGTILSATNEHYAPASQALSPFGAMDMFDGLESARSRDPSNIEELVIKLGKESKLESLVLDFTYFVNNNPHYIEILGKADGHWKTLVSKNDVKAFAGNLKEYILRTKEAYSEVKLRCYPDGGLNRIHVYAKN